MVGETGIDRAVVGGAALVLNLFEGQKVRAAEVVHHDLCEVRELLITPAEEGSWP